MATIEKPAAAVATPAPAPQLTEAELKAQLAAADAKKTEQTKKIGELQAVIDAAKKSHDKFANMPDDEIADPDLFAGDKTKHAAFVARKAETLKIATDALRDYKLTLLTPAEKALREKWDAKVAELDKVRSEQDALKAEILAKYPDFFGTQKVAKKADGTVSKRSEGGKPTFQSLGLTLNSLEHDTAETLRLHNAGTTGQSDIIKAIYGDTFDINESTCPARIRIHSIRVKHGLVASK
jgi:hypothetical protein